MKNKKIKLQDLNVESFSTSKVHTIKGGRASFWYSDCCSGVYTCNGDCDEEDPDCC
ncbi:MAG: pinensin family lanthipeptide [Cyclobacteriaceae bacterium]